MKRLRLRHRRSSCTMPISACRARRRCAIGDETFACITHSFSRSSPQAGVTRAAGLCRRRRRRRASPARTCAARSCWSTASPIRRCRAAPRAPARSASSISARTSIVHEMCISPVWGSPTHETVADLPSTVVVTVPLDGGRRDQGAAGGRCRPRGDAASPRSIPAGARRRSSSPTCAGRATSRSCSSPAITTPGTTASWTMAAPTPP